MPTIEEWEQALVTSRRVLVESSPTLIAEVAARHAKKDEQRNANGQQVPPRKVILTPVNEFAPERMIDIVPAHLLHRLGVATTPPIENLADICSTWAYLRYLWAFEIPPLGAPNPLLRLSEDARGIDFHQKGLLSDQIGVGMAALLLGEYLNAPLPVDVSVAMDDPAWPIVQQYEASPDYISSTLLKPPCSLWSVREPSLPDPMHSNSFAVERSRFHHWHLLAGPIRRR